MLVRSFLLVGMGLSVCVGCVRKRTLEAPLTEPAPAPAAAPVEPQKSDEQRARILLAEAKKKLRAKVEINDDSSAVQLTTKGLLLAPPSGDASIPVVVGLLSIRAQASVRYGENKSALTDLKAARQWLEGAKEHKSYLLALVGLSEAHLLHAQGKSEAALAHAEGARAVAKEVGPSGAMLECEAWVLQGDIASALLEQGEDVEPEAKYRGVYEVAKRYRYPQELWEIAFLTLQHFPTYEDAQLAELMGTIPFLTFEHTYLKQGSTSETQQQKAVEPGGDAPEGGASKPVGPEAGQEAPIKDEFTGDGPGASESDESAPGDPAAQKFNPAPVMAAMRPAFKRCYTDALRAAPQMFGRVNLTLEVNRQGRVPAVRGRSYGISQELVTCLSGRASLGEFNPPKKAATINLPIVYPKR